MHTILPPLLLQLLLLLQYNNTIKCEVDYNSFSFSFFFMTSPPKGWRNSTSYTLVARSSCKTHIRFFSCGDGTPQTYLPSSCEHHVHRVSCVCKPFRHNP